MMKRLLSMFAGCLMLAASPAWGDGTETLGPPSVNVASGTGVYANGTGMLNQPGTITLEVPAGATVKQVLLYWEGFMATDAVGDNTATVSANGGPGVPVVGTLIGGPTLFFNGAYASTFRADITGLGLVGAGNTALQVSDLVFTNVANGAGVVVVFDDGSSNANIALRDGSDLAFFGFAGTLQTTVPQTFTFPASANKDRIALVNLFFASVAGSVSGGTIRPTAIEFTTNGPNGSKTVLNNLLNSVSGPEWDHFAISVNVPAKSDSLTVQALSVDNLGTGFLPASFDWLAAGLSLEPEVPPGTCGRMTGGGSVFTYNDVRVTRGFQIHCDLRDPNNIEVNWPGNKFHLSKLTSAVCTDNPAVAQLPPKSAPFDTFTGTGVGKLNNKPGGRIEFVFVDAGEPGYSDTARIKIFDENNTLVLDVPGAANLPGYLNSGNLQTHKDAKCTQ
jgi:hypothetical protein